MRQNSLDLENLSQSPKDAKQKQVIYKQLEKEEGRGGGGGGGIKCE